MLDWRPPNAAIARIDRWKPDALTIRETIEDIVASEGYYRTGLEDGDQLSDAASEPADLAGQQFSIGPP